jgi:hypothetical protein
MARQSFTICGQTFKTKAALEAEAERIRDAQPIDSPLSPRDADFITNVFRQLYPKYDLKRMAVGARAITVTPILGYRCFRFHLNDGRIVDPSLRKCFSKSVGDPAQVARRAFRYEVYDDCMAYRNAYFARNADASGRAPCELTGQLIAKAKEECEVDHHPTPFQTIVDDFLKERGLALDGITTRDPPHGFGVMLADRAQAADWRAYHLARASFRVLSHTAHVDETKRLRQPPGHPPTLALSEQELATLFEGLP